MTATVHLAPAAPHRRGPLRLSDLLEGSRYLGYTYAYPHKTAYRELAEPRPLATVWGGQPSSIFLYVHVPFCEMRCGFCNLFTQARPPTDLHSAYVEGVERQAAQLRGAVGPRSVVQIAFGGGTPTQLSADLLRRLLTVPERWFGASLESHPTSVETSPETATDAHLAQLVELGVRRVSIGIQSFDRDELRRLGRPLAPATNRSALDRIRRYSLPVLNLDLIYGIEDQSVSSWMASVETALHWTPEELFLYPLYVRPLTGIGRRDRRWIDLRPEMYRQARDRLLDAGYVQFSMRAFRRAHLGQEPAHRCQTDGMLGLGCGARSYTDRLHYSSEWAVSARGVKAIVADWVQRDDFAVAEYGVELDDHEQRTRHMLQSLLCQPGVDRRWYQERFGTDVVDDFPRLGQLVPRGLADIDPSTVRLTPDGLSWSDAVGPWLYSDAVLARMEAFDLR